MTDKNSNVVDVFYDKSRYFRVIHVDGVYGGVAPNGTLHVSPYNERYPLPNVGQFEVDNDGSPITQEISTDRKNGVFREVEADLVFDLGASVSFHTWLGAKIEEMAARNNVPPELLEKLVAASKDSLK